MTPDNNLQLTVLAELMQQPDMQSELPFRLTEEIFDEGNNRKLYKAIMTLHQEGHTTDVLSLFTDRVRLGIADMSAAELAQISSIGYSPAYFASHAALLHDAYKRETLSQLGQQLQRNTESTPDELIQQTEDELYRLTEQSVMGFPTLISESVDSVVSRIEEAQRGGQPITGIASGFRKLDQLTTGFKADTLSILAARPAQGKSAMALTIARNIACQGMPVALFSLEMGREQLIERLLMQDSGLEGEKVRTANLNDAELQVLTRSRESVRSLPIYIDDTTGVSTMQLRQKARKLVRKQGVRMIIVDYLQLMTTQVNASASRENEVSKISRSLKSLAMELHVPVLALSQLNRDMERGHEVREPRLSDLRESGAIEQDADTVMLLHDSPHKQWPEERMLILAKQRSGATGTIRLQFKSAIAMFQDGDMLPTAVADDVPSIF